jgi:hypothetical protein
MRKTIVKLMSLAAVSIVALCQSNTQDLKPVQYVKSASIGKYGAADYLIAEIEITRSGTL